MSKFIEELFEACFTNMPSSIVKRIKAIRTASDEAKAKYVPEPDAPTIRAGGVSGVGAVIAGNGMITRYTLDRDRYGGLPGGSREISITMSEDGLFKVEADGHYRIAEEGEGSDEFDNNDMTPDGEWKNKKTGKISIPKKMKEEKVETHEAVTTASAPKKSKRGSLESRMTEGKQNRYEYNRRDMDELDSTL